MKKQYDKVMEKIQVTDEMRQRILQHIQQTSFEKETAKILRFSQYKKLLVSAACFAILLLGALTLPFLFKSMPSQGPDLLGPANPSIETSSLQELSKQVGFPVEEPPSLPFSVEETTYTAWGNLAQIDYVGESQWAVYRKSEGTEDNSGDYRLYESKIEIRAGETWVTLKGNGNQYLLALWTDGKYAYSLSLSKGIQAEEWQTLLTQGKGQDGNS